MAKGESRYESKCSTRHWHLNDPGVVPNVLQTGAGAPTGITVYEGKLFPKQYWNQLFIVNLV